MGNEIKHIIGERLSVRMGLRDVEAICAACREEHTLMSSLLELVEGPDERTGYNALWVLTHLTTEEKTGLTQHRSHLIDILLTEKHIGKRRLLLTLLESLPTTEADVRGDYIDFCLSKINSTEPYGVRVLCLKQALSQCRFYPELMAELKALIDMMEYSELSPGLLSARKNVLDKIRKAGL